MIILFNTIIPSPDLTTTPLHAIRDDLFSFFFCWFTDDRSRRSWDDRFTRETRLLVFRCNRIVVLKRKRLVNFFYFFLLFSFFRFFSLSHGEMCILSDFGGGARNVRLHTK